MWWTAPLALALAVNPHLDDGRRLYEQLKYPDAEARLKVAAQVPNNTPQEQAQIFDLLARSMIAQGRSADAERVYADLLSRQSDVADPAGASPKIREVFLRAKRGVYPGEFVRLERLSSTSSRLDVELIDPWRVIAAVVLQRSVDQQPFTAVPLALTNRRAGSEVSPRPGETIRCVVEARRADGTVLARLGSVDAPLIFQAAAATVTAAPEVEIEQPRGPTRWPAFLVGAFAIGGVAAGTTLALLSSSDYRSVTDTTGAAQTIVLDNSARSKAIWSYVAFGGAIALAALTAVLVWRW